MQIAEHLTARRLSVRQLARGLQILSDRIPCSHRRLMSRPDNFGFNARDLWAEADALELKFGAEGAVRSLRAQIVEAEWDVRARLYRLHDEIVRRYPDRDWWAILGRP